MKTFLAFLAVLFAVSVYKVYWAPAPDAAMQNESAAQVRIDVAKAEKLKQQAAAGERMAQYELGLVYARGADTLPKDYLKANELLKKAAMQGVPQAMYHLGEMYVNGDGVPENYEEATVWFWLATSLGDKFAERRLRAMNTRISAKSLANAEARVKKLWKEIPHDLRVEPQGMHSN